MRTIIDLNGIWDFSPLYDVICDISLPETCDYEKITVPSSWKSDAYKYGDFDPYNVMEYPEAWNKADTGVLRKNFYVTKKENEVVYLHIEGVAQRCGVYVNRQFVCEWCEFALPLKVDVTDYVVNGENELQVVCTSFEKSILPSGEQKSTGLCGSWFGNMARGIWNDVYIETANRVNISDVIIRTSVRNKMLEVITSVTKTVEHTEIVADVYDGEERVYSLRGKAGSLKGEWQNPIYWDIDRPHLYRLQVTLRVKGEVLDEVVEHFGFREFWNEGTQFILNGTPINLRGDAWHFRATVQMTKQYALNWFAMCKNNGVNYIRLHATPHPRFYLEAADEVGMLIVDETAIHGSGKSMDAANELYISRCKEHVKRLVERDRNHPCVIFWSLENEMRWVDGRDVYKLHIPEMVRIMNDADPTRKVSLDGDNRLISYENTQYESLHYNIDGTIEQWRREKPLTIGEHGGMWYVCPQNASQYVGLQAYDDFEPCAIGFAKKERLFLEYARRMGVSGISTFNFAHYFTYSMPDEDLYFEDAPFKKIPKNSLTINNGYLEDYPICRENPLMPYMREVFRPVTVINREYNHNFYDNAPIVRSFDVYNDTLYAHDCTIKYQFTIGNRKMLTGEEKYRQNPAQHHVFTLELPMAKVKEKTDSFLQIKLYHEDKLQFETTYKYVIYPEKIKTEMISTTRPVYYFGELEEYERIATLTEGARRVENISDVPADTLLLLGAHLDIKPNEIAKTLATYLEKGGVVVVLEQDAFALGNLCLQNQDFFSAYSGNPEHPILQGIKDEDLIFWGPTVTEDRPEPIIHRNFVKPQSGEYTFVLECGAGDYADGGDLWSPLMTMKHGKGTAVFCQLAIDEYYQNVPQAAILLRNLIAYAGNIENHSYKMVMAVGATAEQFLAHTNVEYQADSGDADIFASDIVVADVMDADSAVLKQYVVDGGMLVTLPFDEAGAEKLSEIIDGTVEAIACEVSHLKPAHNDAIVSDISPFDLYRYDKVAMSPRLVENKRIALHTVNCMGSDALLLDVPGTPWEDYYWHGVRVEVAIIPLVSINRERAKDRDVFLAKKKCGKGTVVLSQLKADGMDEKDVRVYTRILENLGAKTRTELFDYQRSAKEYAVDYFMTLPIQPWQDYNEAMKYYTDPQFSLNNLGEGLYGWMKKLEKNRVDGFITVPNSQGKQYFLTCFADKDKQEKVRAIVDCNAEAILYLNGEKQFAEEVILNAGVNRVVIEAKNNKDDLLRFRVIFVSLDGQPIKDLRTHLTIDEVDPK